MSTAVGLAALVVLAGWSLSLHAWTTLGVGGVSMNPLTAVCFLLLAAALLLTLPSPDHVLESGIARACALIVVALATVKLAMLGHVNGPDTWLFRAAVNAATPVSRMAPNTALIVIPIALAVALLDVEIRRWRPAQLLVLVALPLSLIVLVGFLFGVSELYGWGAYIPMALGTAICLLLLELAVLAGRVESGVTSVFAALGSGGVTARRLLPAAILAPLAIGYLRIAGERHGLFGPDFGVVLMTLTMVGAFSVLVWWTASDVHRLDVARAETDVRLQTLIRHVPLGIVVLDREGYVRLCNDAFVELFHYSADALIGRRVDDLIAPEDDEGETTAMTRRGVAGESLRRTTVRRRRDGTLVDVELFVVPLTMNGTPIGTYGVYREIAGRRRAPATRHQTDIA